MVAEETVVAPMPGIFYRRPDPDADPFVEVGDDVTTDDVIGMIGVMKNFNDIRAGVDGTVAEFLVDDEEEIDADQPLVRIEQP